MYCIYRHDLHDFLLVAHKENKTSSSSDIFVLEKKLSKTQRITLAKEILWMLIYFGRFYLTGPGWSGSGRVGSCWVSYGRIPWCCWCWWVRSRPSFLIYRDSWGISAQTWIMDKVVCSIFLLRKTNGSVKVDPNLYNHPLPAVIQY